jgi:hypothetical protein
MPTFAAVKAIQATPGQKVADANIRLCGGGFVVGTVFDAEGKPVSPSKKNPSWVAHYGPARPRTGAAVTSTIVRADGTYRLRVAPGKNFVYSMNGSGTWGIVAVEDGGEARFDIHLGKRIENQPEDADMRLARELRDAAESEDKELQKRRR